MPKPKQKNISQTKERAETAEEDLIEDNTASHSDKGELQVDTGMASLQVI